MVKAVKLNHEPTVGEKMLCAGSAACIAELCTFPLDVAKVRLQLIDNSAKLLKMTTSSPILALNGGNVMVSQQYNGLFGTIFGMIRHEGVKSLYGGIGPGLQRQCVFASIRIGFYDSVKEFYARNLNMSDNTGSVVVVRILSGITTGAIGITCAQPTDVVKVRMQAQTRGTAATNIRYVNSLQAYKSIYKYEGLKGLWKGLGPNVLRNSVVNAAELVCYDSIKDLLISHKILNDGLPCHVSSAFAAGFCATLVSSPIDVVKTRYMNSTSQYKSVLDCAKCLARQGGFMAFYKGFTPSFMRLGTWNICMFVTFEQLKKLATQIKSDRDSSEMSVLFLLKSSL